MFVGFGFLTILAGAGLAAVGLLCATVYLFQAKHAAPDEAARARRDAHRVIALIIANFFIAFVMAWIGLHLMPAFD